MNVIPTFGKFSGCFRPAVYMVGGCIQNGTGEGRERIVYTCDGHLPVAETTWLGGTILYKRPAPGLHWCGVFTDYDPEAE